MSFAIIGNVGEQGPLNGVTTGALDTTGANLIIVSAAWYPGITSTITISDSKSNTWAPLTAQSISGLSKNQLFYCYNPSVGSGHTFTASGSSTYPGIEVLAVSGASASAFDVENGGTANTTDVQPGSVTPSQDNELIVVGLSHLEGTGGGASINGGFTDYDVPYVADSGLGCGIAYLIQTTATAANPTWTVASTTYLAATIATFKASGIAAKAPPPFINRTWRRWPRRR